MATKKKQSTVKTPQPRKEPRKSPCPTVISNLLWSDWVEGECAYDIAEDIIYEFAEQQGYSALEIERIFINSETKYSIVESILHRHERGLPISLKHS